ncbi:MAG: hypothetical protein KIIPBIDF_01558 [Candidatus Methanoperedenaceae archaeon GB50]|nr:hypothetical protein BLFGPEAP_01951 [Candidatus Methanoperedenaceae archaeon GB50]CAD7781961.1 MAG: hypothetical protein KIIPBIDF_01558 [Candidatus Methanoperedenaceae archaeon GB50]
MRLHLRKFNQLLENTEKQVLNPEEKQIIKSYLNKIAVQKVFSLEEFKEFNTMIGKVRKGLSIKEREEFDWIAPGLLSFAMALILDEAGPLSR